MILSRLFGRNRLASQAVVNATYDAIVAAARQPRLYADWNVPDTALGRFESLSLHMILFLARTKSGTPALQGLAQEVVEEFFKDVDHSLRELGIGDAGVPKRMKKLARMFYGRAAAYDSAIEADDSAALAHALARNIVPDDLQWPGADPLARHALDVWNSLKAQDDNVLVSGSIQMQT